MPDELDVFLSHNSRDKPAVEEVAAFLRGRGLRVWLDKDELRPGLPWQEGLEAGVRASRSVAVFVGKDGIGAWQEPEMRAFLARARREAIPVIPVLLPGCPESPQLSLFLEAMTWVDLRNGLTDEGLGRLVWGITGVKSESADPGTSKPSGPASRRKTPSLGITGTRIRLVARDLADQLLSGFRFSYQGIESRPTNRAGATELDLPPEHRPGQQIKIFLLVPNLRRSEEWFLVNPQVNIPTGTAPAEVVLMRRSAFRQIAAEARDASRQTQTGPAEPTAEDRKRILVEAAAHHGLSAEQLEAALLSFAETQDPKDKGIAAYLEGEFSQAEGFLNKAAEKKESDFVETLYYLGASQYEQAKYRAAAKTFRRAVALRGDDPVLLGWLGSTLDELAEWPEAEPLMRRVVEIFESSLGKDHPTVATGLNNLAQLLQDTNRLAEAEPLMRRAQVIDEKSFGPDHPKVAIRLNNLAQLLQATNRLAEAEPLMRRALVIDEKSFGPDHPNVAIRLNNLASLLQATNRLAEAEPLMRRALVIDEKSFGPDHPKVAIRLNNLASLLQATNRLAEAEPLMRRAQVIDERSFGPDHPSVATDLNNLAQLLQATNRLAEAEPLMRRALAIDEKSFGPDHPDVARDLNNLAQLLQATNRLAEAEPLMRRALVIDEKSFGPVHPDVAIYLNNLARLLQATNRLAEAEPLMRRVLEILLEFERRTGHEHPHLRAAYGNYRYLLKEMGKTDVEIEATIEGLGSASN